MYVVSVYPDVLTAVRPWSTARGGARARYTLPPPKEGEKYSSIEVGNAYERVWMGESIGWVENVVPADEIAEDLVREWTGGLVGVSGDARPGVFKTESLPPDDAALAEAIEGQRRYFRHLVAEAENRWRAGTPEEAAKITEQHRMAARWLGMELLPWVSGVREDLKSCKSCGNIIPAQARLCPICKQRQDASGAVAR